MTRAKTLEILRQIWPELALEFGLRSLSLFGSTARDEATDASDVDLLVEFARPAGFLELERLQLRLQGLLKRKVDVSTMAGLRKRIRVDVARELIRVG